MSSTEHHREVDADGNVVREWDEPTTDPPLADATTTTVTVDPDALEAALHRADTATTNAARIAALTDAIRAITPVPLT